MRIPIPNAGSSRLAEYNHHHDKSTGEFSSGGGGKSDDMTGARNRRDNADAKGAPSGSFPDKELFDDSPAEKAKKFWANPTLKPAMEVPMGSPDETTYAKGEGVMKIDQPSGWKSDRFSTTSGWHAGRKVTLEDRNNRVASKKFDIQNPEGPNFQFSDKQKRENYRTMFGKDAPAKKRKQNPAKFQDLWR